uniref:(northern house mosquito) hypothetical protein n=1 Tax=Culex pipiens TaxID=7175 RepID=A0A8D8BGX4_CULPI
MHTFTYTSIPFIVIAFGEPRKNFPFSQHYYQKSIFARVLFPPFSAHLTNCEPLMLARFDWVLEIKRFGNGPFDCSYKYFFVFSSSIYSSCLFLLLLISFLFTLNRNLTFIQIQLVTAKNIRDRDIFFCVLLLRFDFKFLFPWFFV